MAFKSYRDQSRTGWGCEENVATIEQINCGSLMRIADSMEKIAQDRVNLENDLRWHKERLQELRAENTRMGRSIAAYRGIIRRQRDLLEG
jgi:hypothetical protein